MQLRKLVLGEARPILPLRELPEIGRDDAWGAGDIADHLGLDDDLQVSPPPAWRRGPQAIRKYIRCSDELARCLQTVPGDRPCHNKHLAGFRGD